LLGPVLDWELYLVGRNPQDLNLRRPDYYSLSMYLNLPGTGGIFQGGFQLSIDRNGNWYLGPGGSVGFPSALPFSASLTAAWIEGTATDLEVANFCREMSVAFAGGYIAGLAVTYSSGLSADEVGLFTPQIGGSGSYLYAIPPFTRRYLDEEIPSNMITPISGGLYYYRGSEIDF